MIGKLIWGGLLILLGLSFIIKSVWGINIPILKPLLGLFFIYLGFTIIFAPSIINYSYQTHTDGEITQDVRKSIHEYNVILSRKTIDLSQITLATDRITTVKINTIMGSAIVITNPIIPTRFTVSSVLGKAFLPNDSITHIDTALYQTHDGKVEPVLEIQFNIVLGSVTVIPT